MTNAKFKNENIISLFLCLYFNVTFFHLKISITGLTYSIFLSTGFQKNNVYFCISIYFFFLKCYTWCFLLSNLTSIFSSFLYMVVVLKFNSVIQREKWYGHLKNKVKNTQSTTVVCIHLLCGLIKYFVYIKINNICVIPHLQKQHFNLEGNSQLLSCSPVFRQLLHKMLESIMQCKQYRETWFKFHLTLTRYMILGNLINFLELQFLRSMQNTCQCMGIPIHLSSLTWKQPC